MAKDDSVTKLLWVDLEMSGLDPATDSILEVAAIVTDFEFKELGTYEAVIAQPPERLKHLKTNSWWASQPGLKRILSDVAKNGKLEDMVQHEFAQFIAGHFKGEPAILAGNSVHMDRLFIVSHWPEVARKLHYRLVDVSSFKIVMRSKYGIEYKKPEIHRALGDIRASIAELKSYIGHFSA